MPSLPIRNWPQPLRPREKLLAQGVYALSDAELLAIFLRTGATGQSAVTLAQSLLAEFGDLFGLLHADQQAAYSVKGLGPAKWATIQAAAELARRSLLSDLKRGEVLNKPSVVRDFLRLWLRRRTSESFVALFLDNQNRLLSADELFRGSLSQTAVYPREIIRRAIELNAGGIIFAHNHPSGIAEPSHADRLLTEALQSALAHLEIRVLDHVIVADNTVMSFAENGLL